jgi:phosphate:Na+ symporter
VETVTLGLGAGPVDQVVGDDMVNVGRYIANGHTLFNVINASFFLLVLPWLIKVAILLSPKEEEDIDYYRLPNFGDRLIDTPIAAIVETRSEILRMAETAKYTFRKTVKRLTDRDYKKLAKWRQVENHLDDMQREIVAYLTRIYQSGVSESEAKELSSLMRMTNNIERIGDSVENIAQAIEDMIENNLTFTDQAMADMNKLVDKVAAFHGPDFVSHAAATSQFYESGRQPSKMPSMPCVKNIVTITSSDFVHVNAALIRDWFTSTC